MAAGVALIAEAKDQLEAGASRNSEDVAVARAVGAGSRSIAAASQAQDE
jgi:hypothetical protein